MRYTVLTSFASRRTKEERANFNVDNKTLTFGDFIIEKRKEKEISARQLAGKIGISPVYMCDIEKGRKAAITSEVMDALIRTLNLSESETERMYDLAAIARNTVSADLPQYIMENELVRTALRTAKKNQVPDEKWEKFISEVIRKE
jgi:transcriptional regulator with XRE-family HTH domain